MRKLYFLGGRWGARGGDYWTSLLRENSHKLLLVDGHRGRNEERDFSFLPLLCHLLSCVNAITTQ